MKKRGGGSLQHVEACTESISSHYVAYLHSASPEKPFQCDSLSENWGQKAIWKWCVTLEKILRPNFKNIIMIILIHFWSTWLFRFFQIRWLAFLPFCSYNVQSNESKAYCSSWACTHWLIRKVFACESVSVITCLLPVLFVSTKTI